MLSRPAIASAVSANGIAARWKRRSARFVIVAPVVSASIEPLDDLLRVLAEPRRRSQRLLVRCAREYSGAHHFDSLASGQPRYRQRHAQPAIVETRHLDRLADAAHH